MSDATNPPSAFEAMLVDILKGQWPALKLEDREAKATALAKVIVAGMKRQSLSVINAADVVNLRGDFQDADLAEIGGGKLVESFAAESVRRILTSDLVMRRDIDGGTSLCISIIAPGWAVARAEMAQPDLARQRIRGNA